MRAPNKAVERVAGAAVGLVVLMLYALYGAILTGLITF